MIKIACIPAFNEERIISDIVKRTGKYVDKVVVCDDGSSDRTSLNAKNAGAHIIRHKNNLGKGAALKSLFEYVKKSKADVIVTIDGDGQFLPEEIPKLVKPILEKKADIVVGYRFDSEEDMPKYRKIGNKLLDKMTNIAAELPIRDTQSGFRTYSRKAIDSIDFQTKGFGADSEILIDASKKGLKISEEKVKVIYDTGGKTSTKNPISHSGDVVGSLLEQIALIHPLKYLGIPGIVLLTIGIAYSIVVIAIFNADRYFSIPSTLVAASSLITGLMLLLMSVVLFSISRSVRRI